MIQKYKSGVIVVTSDETIANALDKMATNKVGSIIVTKEDKPHGIITERDVLTHWRRLADTAFLNAKVTKIMTSPLVTVTPDRLSEAATIMAAKKIRHIPVLDNGGGMLGILSMRDLLQAQVESTLGKKGLTKTPTNSATKKTGSRFGGKMYTIHLITPSMGLEMACKNILPLNWTFKSWLDPNALFDEKKFSDAVIGGESAFFVDLDGLKDHDWRRVLKRFILTLTHDKHPEVFIAWSPAMLKESAVDALIKVAATARWTLFQKPLALAALSEEFKKLDERARTKTSPASPQSP